MRLGDKEIDDSEHHQTDTVNPDFYKMFELNTELPGASQLEVEVWDFDDFSSNDLIGKTVRRKREEEEGGGRGRRMRRRGRVIIAGRC